MSNEQPPSSRPPRSGGMSVSSTLSIIVAAIAVLLGFLVLRDLDRDRGGSSTPSPGTEAPIDSTAAPTTAAPTTTTSLVTTGFKVIVANASGVGGSAGQMTTALQSRGFVACEPLNAAESFGRIDVTVVYALSGYEAGAQSVAAVLGGAEVLAMPTPPPVEGGDLGECQVLVMLGTDLAGKPLPSGDTSSATNTTLSAETTTTLGG